MPDTQLFHDVFIASPIGMAVESLEGQPLFVNPALCSMLGFSEEELRTKHCVDFSPPEDAEKDWELFKKLRAGAIDHYQLEKRYFRRDGSLVWGRLTISLLKSRPSPLVIAMVEDITDKKASEAARFRHAAIVESSDDAIISKDLDAVITGWNPAAQRIFGYTEAEVVGQPISILIPPELGDEENMILERAKAGERIEHYETIRVTKTGKKVNVSLTISPILDSTARVVGFSKIARDITARKLAEEELAGMSRKLIEAQEQDRARIGRDLHDDINQQLALLAIDIEQLRQHSPDSTDEIRTRLTAVRDRVTEIATNVQSVSHQLHSPQLEILGIVAAMRGFCRELAAHQKVVIDFTHDDIPKRLSKEVSLCLFRVLQEALHNAVKHSNVRHYEVRLGCSASEVQLTISDRGTGFDAGTVMNCGGLGLVSMRERVRLVNGTIRINSEPMRGTSIHVRVQLPSEQDSERAAG